VDFNYSDEQLMLRDTLSRYLADHYSFEQRQAAIRCAEGRRGSCWNELAELGLFGILIPESQGGMGGGAVDVMIVMEAFGAALVVEPFLGTVVIGGGLLRRAGGALAAQMLPRIAAGEVRMAFASAEPESRYNLADLQTTATRRGSSFRLNGRKAVVVGAPWATHFMVTARTAGGRRDREGVSLLLIDRNAPGVRTLDYPTVDGGRASDLWFEDVELGPDALIGEADAAWPLLEQVVDEAIVATCAETCGVMRRMLADTVDYARQRKQFGVPIGSFQALQHRMVDMHVHIEQTVSLTCVAAMKSEAVPLERALAASTAKVKAARAAQFVGQGAVQVHGGMGITEELAVGHHFKRATVLEHAFGSADHHLGRYGELRRLQSTATAAR